MKPTCGICSSQVFFSLAAVTGCISVIFNMTSIDPHLDSGARRVFTFGPTYVVEPKGKHQATIVWLHGLGDNGLSWCQILETLPLSNIKWICPTAPVQPITLYNGLSRTAWFDVTDISEDASQDVEGMDASTAHVLSLLSAEPPNIKLGVGGFSMGGATAIYSARCFARGKFGNGAHYSTHLEAVVSLSGWLPCANDPINKAEGSAASLPILLCHGRGDDMVWFRYGEKSAEKLALAGFKNLTLKSFHSLGHHIIPEEMDVVSSWLTSKLALEGEGES